MKPKTGFTCPNCGTRLIVPALPDGTFSSDHWLCPQCHQQWHVDDVDEFKKAQCEDRHRRVQDSARPKRQPNLL